MCKQLVNINLVVDDKLSTLGLQVRRKSPRTHQCYLTTIDVGANLECDVAPLPNVTGPAPSLVFLCDSLLRRLQHLLRHVDVVEACCVGNRDLLDQLRRGQRGREDVAQDRRGPVGAEVLPGLLAGGEVLLDVRRQQLAQQGRGAAGAVLSTWPEPHW